MRYSTKKTNMSKFWSARIDFSLCARMALALAALSALASDEYAAPADVSFKPSASSVDAYDFVEVTIAIAKPDARNPFTDASVTGSFEPENGGQGSHVDGFCDSPDGSVYRIRFMPSAAGDYKYTITYRQGPFQKRYSGVFHAANGHRKGIIRIDPQHRWHFIWEGTGEHYFFNGTTAYWLTGWKDERIIRNSIDRLHRLKVNRILRWSAE